ncbi:hypothetical protein Peur_070480 [Populus x canadensis]
MDVRMQIALPILGTVAADAAASAGSFSELREKSLRDLDEHEDGGFESSLSSRKRRARRKAEKEDKN